MEKEVYIKLQKYQTIAIISIIINIIFGGYLMFNKQEVIPTPDLLTNISGQTRKFGGGQTSITTFIDPVTGEVNQEQIDNMKSKFPDGTPELLLARITDQLNSAVKAGDITQEQSDNVLKALLS